MANESIKFKMAAAIGYLSMTIGTAGIFLGFYHMEHHPALSLKIITMTTVGVTGVLAFVRHFFFHQSDARRLGWETERPEWAFEVGFANLAFGLVGWLAVIGNYSAQTQAVLVLGYALYLFQAGLLHGHTYFTEGKKSAARLWRSCLATLLYAGMMSFFAIKTLCIQ